MTKVYAVAESVPVTLNDCPPGLFLFGGRHLGFKTEYVTTLEDPRRYQVDAYVVESGEYFHGGAKGCEERGKLLVQPICIEEEAPTPEQLQGAVEALEALEAARQFITNGIEFGYIRMPDTDTPDSAHDTLPLIEAALDAFKKSEVGHD